jgi:hypothetical protein
VFIGKTVTTARIGDAFYGVSCADLVNVVLDSPTLATYAPAHKVETIVVNGNGVFFIDVRDAVSFLAHLAGQGNTAALDLLTELACDSVYRRMTAA